MTWKSASAYQTELWQIQHAKSTTILRDTSCSTTNSFHVVFFSRSGPPPTTSSPLLPILWKWLPPIPFALNSICRELRNWCRAYWSLKSKPFVSFRQEEEWRTQRAQNNISALSPLDSLLCIVQKGSTFANCSIFRQNDGPMQPVRSF